MLIWTYPTTTAIPRYYSGYTLLESIGQGGMSAIDLAQTTVTDAQYVRFVVIKRMHAHLGESDDSMFRMFQDEAEYLQNSSTKILLRSIILVNLTMNSLWSWSMSRV